MSAIEKQNTIIKTYFNKRYLCLSVLYGRNNETVFKCLPMMVLLIELSWQQQKKKNQKCGWKTMVGKLRENYDSYGVITLCLSMLKCRINAA